jgi:hypothetical protein
MFSRFRTLVFNWLFPSFTPPTKERTPVNVIIRYSDGTVEGYEL